MENIVKNIMENMTENYLNVIMSLAVIGTFVIITVISCYYLCKYKTSKTHIVVESLFVDRVQFNGGPNPCSHTIDKIEFLGLTSIGGNLFSEK